MNHINMDFAKSVIKVFYKQNQDAVEDYNVSFDEFNSIFDETILKRSINLANDILKHPGKYGKAIAKSLKYTNLTEKKKLCLTYASMLIDQEEVANNEA